jgi:hypothetical protein
MSVDSINPICGVVIGVIIVVFIFVFVFLLTEYRSSGEKKWLAGSMVALFIVGAGIGFEIYTVNNYHYETNHKTLEYHLEVNSTSNEFEEIYVPISQSSYLQSSLRIESGTGRFSIINTQQGLALWVNFSGHIEIVGKVETLGIIGEHALTMLNTTDEYWDKVEHWIRYLPDNSSDFKCSYRLTMNFETLWEYEDYLSEGYLGEGWMTYWAEYSYVVA